jgi:hypothetical protein
LLFDSLLGLVSSGILREWYSEYYFFWLLNEKTYVRESRYENKKRKNTILSLFVFIMYYAASSSFSANFSFTWAQISFGIFLAIFTSG